MVVIVEGSVVNVVGSGVPRIIGTGGHKLLFGIAPPPPD